MPKAKLENDVETEHKGMHYKSWNKTYIQSIPN